MALDHPDVCPNQRSKPITRTRGVLHPPFYFPYRRKITSTPRLWRTCFPLELPVKSGIILFRLAPPTCSRQRDRGCCFEKSPSTGQFSTVEEERINCGRQPQDVVEWERGSFICR